MEKTALSEIILLLERLGKKNIRQKVEFMGLEYEYGRKILNGERSLTDEIIIYICEKASVPREEIKRLLAMARIVREEGKAKSYWQEMADGLSSAGTPVDMPRGGFVKVNIYSNIRAGCSNFSPDCADIVGTGNMTEEEYKSNCFLLRVSGDSMATTIEPGDVVLFARPENCPTIDGKICACEVEGHPEWLLKRVRIGSQGNIIVLESENKKHAPIIVDTNTTRLEIKGVAKRFTRSFDGEVF